MTSENTALRTEARPSPPAPDLADSRRRGAVLFVMCVGMFLVLLDVTIVNVALPTIRSDLGTGLGSQQWVVDGYAVVIAGLLLGGGAVGDRVGHRGVVLLGLGLFTVASTVCGLAPGVGVLIAGRAAQGAGAALLLPGTLAVILRAYPGRAEQARALGLWAMVSSLALPAGPLVGGVLVATIGWRGIFLINVPLGVAATVAVLRLVRGGAPAGRERLDVAGMLTAPIALGAVVFAVINAEHSGASTLTLGAAALGLLGIAVFVGVERRVADPMLPLGLLRVPAFVSANCAALIMNLVFNGTLFVVTLNLQSVQHAGPVAAGLGLLPLAVPMVAMPPLASRLIARFGPQMPMAVGMSLAAAGAASMCLLPAPTTYPQLLPALLGLGVGGGIMTTSVVAAAVRSVAGDASGLASGVNNMMRQTGTALGVALFGAVAGRPEHLPAFVAGWHHVGWLAVGLWALALGLTAVSRRGASVPRSG